MARPTIGFLLCFLVVHSLWAQEPSEFEDLRGKAFVPEDWAEILKPRGPTPPELRPTRGARKAVSCDWYRGRPTQYFESKLLGGLDDVPTSKSHGKAAISPIAFELDSAELTGAAKDYLEKLGMLLEDDTIENMIYGCVLIGGHADETGSEEHNQDLSERRAEAVSEFLSGMLVQGAERLLTYGYSERYPRYANTSEAGRQKNRRVEFISLGLGEVKASPSQGDR